MPTLISWNCRELSVELAPSLGTTVSAVQKRHSAPAVEKLLDLLGSGRDESSLVGQRQRVEETLYK